MQFRLRTLLRAMALAPIWSHVIQALRFVADNTDRELASKIAAVVIAVGYTLAVAIAIVFCKGVTRDAFSIVPLFFLPLPFIWFPEVLGGFTGYVSGGRRIDTETPPAIVAFIGWLLLVLIGVALVAIALGN
jgi:uncharacterized membrane protein YoaT (DUF817 family)